MEIEQLGVGRVQLGENEVLEGEGHGSRRPQPAVRRGSDEVLRREGLKDGNGEHQVLWLA